MYRVCATQCACWNWSKSVSRIALCGNKRNKMQTSLCVSQADFSRSLGLGPYRASRRARKKCRAHALGKKRDVACGRSNPLTQFQYSSSPKAAGSLNFRWGAFRNIQGHWSKKWNYLTSAFLKLAQISHGIIAPLPCFNCENEDKKETKTET